MKKEIKKYCKENIRIEITDFELTDVSYYGCDADVYFEIRDKETNVLLASKCEYIQWAFMGIDEGEELDYFLENKGIDFTKDYDDDICKLPANLLKEFEDYKLDYYNEAYHELFFDDDSSSDEYIIRIRDQLCLEGNKFYIIHGKNVVWSTIKLGYFGIYPYSKDVKINRVYDTDTQRYIYEVEGDYFDISGYWYDTDFSLSHYERLERSEQVVTADDFYYDKLPGYMGYEGDVVYSYR